MLYQLSIGEMSVAWGRVPGTMEKGVTAAAAGIHRWQPCRPHDPLEFANSNQANENGAD
jgi:hypothetical protein